MSNLILDPAIGLLFRSLLTPPDGVQLFCNRVDLAAGPLQQCLFGNMQVSGINCTFTDQLDVDDKRIPWQPEWLKQHAENISIINHEQIEFFRPLDKFHLAFSAFPFEFNFLALEKDQVKPAYVNDQCQFFRASEGKEERRVPYHLLGLEQMLKAVFCGGYFAAVLPKRWIGREMKYLQWWNDHAAMMARVKLPKSTVKTLRVYEGEDVQVKSEIVEAPGDWELIVWTRPLVLDNETELPNSLAKKTMLAYAKQRQSPFVLDLSNGNLSAARIKDCAVMFHQHNWYQFSVENWKAMLQDNHADFTFGTWNNSPRGLDDPKNIYFFNPKPEYKTQIKVLPSVEAIKAERYAVHIKAGRAIKLKTYNLHSGAAILDMKLDGNFTTVPDGDDSYATVYKYDQELRYKPFTQIKEQLISDLENRGLLPCMTEHEHYNLLKKERWLEIQLAPIERLIPIGSEAKAAHEGQQTGNEQLWETAYTDIGMESTFPEIMDLWRARAKKMGLHQYLYDFQLKDVIYYAAKASIMNGSVPGLGKTRTSLFGELLRGARKILIICPSKLIGVWQDEIDNTILPYCRMQRRNWQGHILDPSYQVIEWAKDCLPINLKTFNIISYDKLKSTPRDGRFYKCPKCGTIVYSAKAVGKPHGQHTVNGQSVGNSDDITITCSGDPFLPQDHDRRCNNLVRRWQRLCNGNVDVGQARLRKLAVYVDEQGEPLTKQVELKDGDGTVVETKTELLTCRFSHPAWRYFNHSSYATRLAKFAEKFPLEIGKVKIVDQRPPRPMLPTMEMQEHLYKKVKKKLLGYEDKSDGSRVPIVRNIERKSHVKWSFSDLIRWSFKHIIADEALYFMNDDAQRTRAMYHLAGSNRVALTGTPMKNKPENVLGIMNWTFSRDVFPYYRAYDPDGNKRFLDKYRTVVYIEAGEVPGAEGFVAGKEKPLPKVNNPELFQAEMAPLMVRHVRNEPPVQKDIPPKELVHHDIKVTMDPEHKAYYQLWLAEFVEWWGRMKEEEEGKSGVKGALLTKLTYLANCSITPYSMLDNILKGKDPEAKGWARKIGTYKDFCVKNFGRKERPTAKMRKAFEIIRAAVKDGDKTICFSLRKSNLFVGEAWSKKNGLEAMVVHGGISNDIPPGKSRSKRHEMIEQFKHYAYNVLWAGLGCLAEGVNIPEANHGIILDCGWEPATPTQGIGRMIRPAQTKTINRYNMMHLGAIDDYMFALCYLKGRSGSEAIDYMDFDDFSVDVIPDINQYANSIVDGTEEEVKRRMWLAVDHLRKREKEEGEDQEAE